MGKASAFGVVYKSWKAGFPGSKDDDFIPVTQMSPEDRSTNLQRLRMRRYMRDNPSMVDKPRGSIVTGGDPNDHTMKIIERQRDKYETSIQRARHGKKTSPLRHPILDYHTAANMRHGLKITRPNDAIYPVVRKPGPSRRSQQASINNAYRYFGDEYKSAHRENFYRNAKAGAERTLRWGDEAARSMARSRNRKLAIGTGVGALALGSAGAYMKRKGNVKKSDKKPEITGPRMQALDLNTDECVEWPGAMRNGYGVKKMGNTTVNAHRWVYEQATGKKIPKGMAVDHTCRNRKCVNPKHLEVVSHGENKLRAWGFKSGNYKHKYYKGEPVEKGFKAVDRYGPLGEPESRSGPGKTYNPDKMQEWLDGGYTVTQRTEKSGKNAYARVGVYAKKPPPPPRKKLLGIIPRKQKKQRFGDTIDYSRAQYYKGGGLQDWRTGEPIKKSAFGVDHPLA
mgnify:CR=1 FL=1